MTHGACWITWGDKQPDLLWRSVESARKFGLHTCLITDAPVERGHLFDDIRRFEPEFPDCRCRAAALIEYLPFDLTLVLDTDTVICKPVDYGFQQAKIHTLACCIAPASNAAQWHDIDTYGDCLPQYNGGVLFMSRAITPLLRQWRENNDPQLSRRFVGQDQPGLAAAIEELHMSPKVLPKEWNFRAGLQTEGCGPVHIWHSPQPVPDALKHATGFWRLDTNG